MRRPPAPLAASLAALAFLALAACDPGPRQTAVTAGDLPPIEADYPTKIVAWARGFFAGPARSGDAPLRDARLSDPALVRDTTGQLVWLVCLDVAGAAGAPDGAGPTVRRRFAFGFAPNFMSAPLAREAVRPPLPGDTVTVTPTRVRSSLIGADCDDRPLRYRPFPAVRKR